MYAFVGVFYFGFILLSLHLSHTFIKILIANDSIYLVYKHIQNKLSVCIGNPISETILIQQSYQSNTHTHTVHCIGNQLTDTCLLILHYIVTCTLCFLFTVCTQPLTCGVSIIVFQLCLCFLLLVFPVRDLFMHLHGSEGVSCPASFSSHYILLLYEDSVPVYLSGSISLTSTSGWIVAKQGVCSLSHLFGFLVHGKSRKQIQVLPLRW